MSAPASSIPGAAEILDGFRQDRVEPVRISIVYRLALTAVAVLMVLLPVIYLALIAVAGWGVYWHATEHWEFAMSGRGRGIFLTLLAYATPLFVGVVLVFFMIKPLFVRRERGQQPLTLAPGEEPLLEAFVQRLVSAVGAPMPRVIELDCQVNAAAGFRRGLVSFLGNDLKLIIGLPLVAGMDLRSFGGVLAHEFGHFSQGAGLRLTYVIRSVNGWFARVVFDRDAWDARLEEAASGAGEWYLIVLINSARGMVWLTRKILFGLMWLGHAVSSFALRQMEFDADTYEARFAGSQAFGQTCRRLHQLNAGFGQTIGLLQQTYRDRRLSVDLPGLARLHTEALPADSREAIEDVIAQGKTALFDTHPCDRERIASAERLAVAGIFASDLPASVLFRDFPALCERVTQHYYVAQQELKVEDVRFEDNATLFDESKAERDQAGACERVFLDVPHARRSLPVVPVEGVDLAAERAAFAELAAAKKVQQENYGEALQKRDHALAIAELLRSGYTVKEDHLPLSTAEAGVVRTSAALKELDAALARLAGAGLASLPEGERELWSEVFHALHAAEPDVNALEDLTTQLAVLMNNAGPNGNVPEASYRNMEARGAEIEKRLQSLREILECARYPLKHKDSDVRLSTVLNVPGELSTMGFVRQMQIADRSLPALRRVIFAGLSRLAAEIERTAPLAAIN